MQLAAMVPEFEIFSFRGVEAYRVRQRYGLGLSTLGANE